MKNWLILLPLVPSLAFSITGPEDAPPPEPTDMNLSWLDSLSMSLHLPDTTQLTLLLSPASNIPGEPTPCLFSGTVEQDHRSMVAVTGCKESPETDVTIASRLVPNGLVDLVIVNGSTFTVKEDSSSTEDRTLGAGDDCLEPPADPHSSQHHLAAGSAMPWRVILKTYMRYDNTLLRKFGGSHTSTKQWLSRVVEMSRPRLVHSSLDTGLQLQVVGEMEHHNEDIQADGPTINRLARNPKERNLVSYFGYQLGGGIIGVAFRGTACREDGYAVNINELYSSSNSEMKTARVWVHELGHNIGMRHDFDATHGGQSGPCNNQGLMSYGNSPDKWSACSNADFAEWFRREGNVCLKPTSTGVARACEGKTLSLNCGSGQQIDVVSANYGRLGRTYCPHSSISNTNCRSSSSLNVVKARCQGRSSCSVPATNSVFGDPCYGTYKYLEVNFSCKPKGSDWVQLSSYPRGRVELYKNGQWGTLCGHYWWDNQKGAENICKALGYAGGTKYTAPGGSGPILAGNRLCNGGEATVWDCPLKRPETTGCTHDIDQGVSCTGRSKGTCATFYEHGDYKGKSLTIQEGKTPYSMFSDNSFNDKTSSIRVKPGCRVQYWEHGSYDGKTGTATRDNSSVGSSWNDKISSAICAC